MSGSPRVYALPFFEILEGVALESFAVPPAMVSLKSAAVKSALPPFPLKTGSLNVTTNSALFASKVTLEISGLISAAVSTLLKIRSLP